MAEASNPVPTQLQDLPEMLTANDLASLLQTTTRTIRRLVIRGVLPTPRRFGALNAVVAPGHRRNPSQPGLAQLSNRGDIDLSPPTKKRGSECIMANKDSEGKVKQSAATCSSGWCWTPASRCSAIARDIAFAVLKIRETRQTYPLRSKKFRAFCRGSLLSSRPGHAGIAGRRGGDSYAGEHGPPRRRMSEMFTSASPRTAATVTSTWPTRRGGPCEVRPGSWKLVTNPPVYFSAGGALLALPAPVRGGRLADLRKIVHVTDKADWYLLVAWLTLHLLSAGRFPYCSWSDSKAAVNPSWRDCSANS